MKFFASNLLIKASRSTNSVIYRKVLLMSKNCFALCTALIAGIGIKFSKINSKPYLLSAIFFIFSPLMSNAEDVNVLIVGTTYDTGEYGTDTYGKSKAFDISKVRTELENILSGATLGSVKVSIHDYSSNSSSTGAGNRLIEEYLSQNSYYAPIDVDFWKELRGESGTDWDYVILMGEPHTIEYFPGLYTLGVSEIGKEVAKGNGETVLLMGWPAQTSDSTVNHYKEVVYRTGRSLGYKVVPAGLSWQAQGSVYGTEHPTDNGAYLTAAAIYSRVWGVEGGLDKSASESTYSPNPVLADAVHANVKMNKGKAQYSGKFTHPSNVFAPLNDYSREWRMGSISSSTESTLKKFTSQAAVEAGMEVPHINFVSGPKALFLSRGNDYDNNFLMSSGFRHPGSGGSYYSESGYINLIASDFGSMLRDSRNNLINYPTFRQIPQPALWAKVSKELPSTPFIEAQHGGRGWGLSSGAYLVTIKTGRCSMIPDLADVTVESNALQVGYEMGWAMSTLQGRAPGFKVMPSAVTRHEVDPAGPETMTVRFMFKPRQNVTVNIATDKSWASVSPQTLTFTPENYNTPQAVTVSLSTEAENHRAELFNVLYTTESTDEVYDDLADSWEYGVNTLPIVEAKNITALANDSTDVTLTAIDPDLTSRIIYKTGSDIPKQVISYSIDENFPPQNGEVSISGNILTYTPNLGFIGTDNFRVFANDGLDFSSESTVLNVSVVAQGQYDFNLIKNPGAEFGVNDWNGAWYSLLNNSSPTPTAHSGTHSFRADTTANKVEFHQDVDISHYSSSINAGLQFFHFSGYGEDDLRDDARLALEFRDLNGQVLGSPYESERVNSKTWKLVETTLQAPANAVTARVILRATRLKDSKNFCHFDTLSLTAVKPQNSAPVAVDPPLASIAMNVPTLIPLQANDVDPADTLTYEIVNGPYNGQITGWKNGIPVYTPNAGYLGNDSFQFRVFDGQVYSANTATATILVRSNEAPVVTINTPTSETIFMAATNGLIFETKITDDGGPYPSNLTVNWQQISGPVTAVFGSPNSETTTCNWGDFNPGTYEFRVTASDGQYETVRNFTVTVLNGGYNIPENIAPQVDVGGPYNSVGVGELLNLDGNSLSDDGKPVNPGVTKVQWLQVSGPGKATFSNASNYQTGVAFDQVGIYTLRLTADDGQVKSYEDLLVHVADNLPPTVNAGADQTVDLSGSVTAPATSGAGIYLNASLDNGSNNTWEDSLSTWDLALDSSVSFVANTGSLLPGISSAYSFNGTGGARGASFNNSWDKEPLSIELWFKPNSTADDGASNGQVLFETGGTTGLGVFYNDGAIEVGHDSTEVISSYDVSTLAGEFIQAVLTYDETTFTLYVNGSSVAAGTKSDLDWSGSDSAGLGTRGGTNVGGRGNGDAGTKSFEGQIAIFRAYRNKVLSGAEVLANFNSVAGGVSAKTNLNGIVNDPDGDPLASTWSLVSGPAGVNFSNPSSTATTATFTVAGTYTLRLTANDGKVQTSDDIVITVNELTEDNTAPIATNESVTTGQDTAVAVTLIANDADGDSLSYSVVSDPANGTLSGTGANRTYTPNAGFFGSDSFTFKVNDGTVDSNTAIVSVTVTEASNTPPAVNAGADQTITLTEGSDRGNGETISLTPSAHIRVTDETTKNRLGNIGAHESNSTYCVRSEFDIGRQQRQIASFIQFDLSGISQKTAISSAQFVIDYSTRLHDKNSLAVLLGRNTQGSWDISGSNYPLYDWGRKDEDGTVKADILGTLVTDVKTEAPVKKDLSVDVTQTVKDWLSGVHANDGFVIFADRDSTQAAGFNNARLLISYVDGSTSSASVSLNGSASDADGDSLTTSWNLVNGPAGVSFADASSLSTTATFTTAGTYTLRLAANDGKDLTFDDVVITVSESNTGTSTAASVSSIDRIAWYSFDSDATNADGLLKFTLTGAQAADADAKYGSGSLKLADSSQYGHIADDALLNIGGPWAARTIAVWFKLDTINGRQVILEEGGSVRGFNFYIDNGSLYVGGWDKNKDNGDVDTWTGTWHNLGSVNAGEWYHAALVLDASANPGVLSNSAFKAYLNGTLAAAGNGMQISAHGDDFGIGKLAGGTLYHDGATGGNAEFKGNIDDLVIWNRALSSAEMAILAGTSSASQAALATEASSLEPTKTGDSITGTSLETDSSEIIIGSNAPLTIEEKLNLASTLDLLAINEGTFTMIVTTDSGTYTFYLEPGDIFDYKAVSENEFTVTYSTSDEIMDMIDILFSDDPVLQVKFP